MPKLQLTNLSDELLENVVPAGKNCLLMMTPELLY
jgi:hypothetical protein